MNIDDILVNLQDQENLPASAGRPLAVPRGTRRQSFGFEKQPAEITLDEMEEDADLSIQQVLSGIAGLAKNIGNPATIPGRVLESAVDYGRQVYEDPARLAYDIGDVSGEPMPPKDLRERINAGLVDYVANPELDVASPLSVGVVDALAGGAVKGAKYTPEVLDYATRKATGDLVGFQPAMSAMPNPNYGRIGGGFDPRYDPRKLEVDRLRDLKVGLDPYDLEIPEVSLVDFEGRPFVSSMSDRTRADADILSLKDIDLDNPIHTYGGQDYMFKNPGKLWASDKRPVNQLNKLAGMLQEQTGQSPIFLPWRMAPTGGDYAHMTGETMLEYAGKGLGKRNINKANKEIKKFIPDWPGIGTPGAIEVYRRAPGNARKEIKNMLDTNFRNEGGLSIGEARLAVSDPRQLGAREGGIQNVGEFSLDRPAPVSSSHPTYNTAIAGEGIGRLKEDLGIHQLLPDVVAERGVDVLNPSAQDLRSLQMKPYGGIITEDLLRNLGF